MIDYELRECPFCGNPAEIIDSEPFSFMPKVPTKAITCSNEWCIGHGIKVRYQPDVEPSVKMARSEWNTRRRKNKVTWREKCLHGQEHSTL